MTLELWVNFSFYFKYIFFSTLIFILLLEYNCFAVLCWFLLYNKVSQLYIYTPPPSWAAPHSRTPALWAVTEPRAQPPVCTVASCWLFTRDSVYMPELCSQLVPRPLLPALCPQGHSVRLCLYSRPASRFICTIFLDSLYLKDCEIWKIRETGIVKFAKTVDRKYSQYTCTQMVTAWDDGCIDCDQHCTP